MAKALLKAGPEGRSIVELRRAVKAGVAHLEERFPNGVWRRFFRLKDFKFTDPCRCVIGTIGQCMPKTDRHFYNEWARGLDALGLVAGSYEVKDYGFDWVSCDEAPVLAELWRRVLKGERI